MDFSFFKARASKQQNAWLNMKIFLINTKVTSFLLGLLWKVNGDFVFFYCLKKYTYSRAYSLTLEKEKVKVSRVQLFVNSPHQNTGGVAIPSPGSSPNPGIELISSTAGGYFTPLSHREAHLEEGLLFQQEELPTARWTSKSSNRQLQMQGRADG